MRRTTLGMSQTTLGESVGITFQQIQKYEKGHNRIGASRLQAMAQVLRVPVTYFFEGSPDSSTFEGDEQSALIASFVATADGQALIKAFSKVADRDVRASIVQLVSSIAESRSKKN